ncbi:uncharacterized protein LOC118199312 [Stegodyphus dumicola]|uniref:uncharacterized protein LOC118199312 n=1 Tax=Stegodyphus dumicola TaxID=202533 RepID=UPI0015ACA32D|nr:uncharacterized protein LOC118199312 [Stegodyphus dumicola]
MDPVQEGEGSMPELNLDHLKLEEKKKIEELDSGSKERSPPAQEYSSSFPTQKRKQSQQTSTRETHTTKATSAQKRRKLAPTDQRVKTQDAAKTQVPSTTRGRPADQVPGKEKIQRRIKSRRKPQFTASTTKADPRRTSVETEKPGKTCRHNRAGATS